MCCRSTVTGHRRSNSFSGNNRSVVAIHSSDCCYRSQTACTRCYRPRRNPLRFFFTSRFANENRGNALYAFPIFISVQGYRGEYQQHHIWTNTHEDPYPRMFDQGAAWQWPKTNGQALWQLFTDVTGLNTHRNLRLIRRWAPFALWIKHSQNPKLNRRLNIAVLNYL